MPKINHLCFINYRYQSWSFLNQDICFLPTLLFSSIFPCNIRLSILYCWFFLIMCTMYSSSWAFVFVKSSFYFPTLSSILWLVIQSLKVLVYISKFQKLQLFFLKFFLLVSRFRPLIVIQRTHNTLTVWFLYQKTLIVTLEYLKHFLKFFPSFQFYILFLIYLLPFKHSPLTLMPSSVFLELHGR